jgi:uncharacterized protein involved in exopolysaccharide biosynthesis
MLGIGDYIAILRRRMALFFIPFIIILSLGLTIAFVLPPVYYSEAKILIERQEIPEKLVATTVTGYVQKHIEEIKQRLVTYDNLLEIAKKLNLYPDMINSGAVNEALVKIRQSISVAMVDIKSTSAKDKEVTIAFTVGYAADNAETAKIVATELANRYLQENKALRAEQTVEVSRFLEHEAERLRKEIEELEVKLAAFKQEKREQLPELLNLNLKLYEKTEGKIEDTRGRILKLEDSIAAIQSELSLTDPRKAVRTEDGKVIQSPTERLSAMTAEFLQASARYTPTHPDIIKLRREIQALGGQSDSAKEINRLVSALTRERSQLLEARQKYADDHPDVRKYEKTVAVLENKLRNVVIVEPENSAAANVPADNPRYVALKTQLDSAYSNLKEEKAKLRNYNEKLRDYEKRLYQTPVVERDYQSLSRDYGNAKAKYQDLKNKQLQARLAEQLEAGEKGQRFVLAGKAFLPSTPQSPNRLGIALISGLLAFSGGLGSVAVGEYMDRSIRGKRGVVSALGMPPIAAIPFIDNLQGSTKIGKRKLVFVFVIIGLLIVVLAAVHVFIKPLDELQKDIMHKDKISSSVNGTGKSTKKGEVVENKLQ